MPRLRLPRTISWASRITLVLAAPWAVYCLVVTNLSAPHAWVLTLVLFIVPVGLVWLVFRVIFGDRGCVY